MYFKQYNNDINAYTGILEGALNNSVHIKSNSINEGKKPSKKDLGLVQLNDTVDEDNVDIEAEIQNAVSESLANNDTLYDLIKKSHTGIYATMREYPCAIVEGYLKSKRVRDFENIVEARNAIISYCRDNYIVEKQDVSKFTSDIESGLDVILQESRANSKNNLPANILIGNIISNYISVELERVMRN